MGNRRIDDSVKEQYLEWLCTPPTEREPETKDAMSELLGVAPSTLWSWEQSDEFQEALRELKSTWGARFHGDILSRLIQIVKDGTDTSAIQASKVLLNHLDTGSRESREEDLTDEQLARIRRALESEDFQVL